MTANRARAMLAVRAFCIALLVLPAPEPHGAWRVVAFVLAVLWFAIAAVEAARWYRS